ncbi:MAG: alpha/beta hydrolase [Candidatus Sumerlaeota bacterium]|nr:alpha/beta hydrolase [Candidatus Sumerlaeota bacterium]
MKRLFVCFLKRLFVCFLVVPFVIALGAGARGAELGADGRKGGGQGGFSYPPKMPGARVETYKITTQTQLQLYIYAPQDTTNAAPRPAIIFFFGGGWASGSPAQFEPQCRYLASRGMVAISADYRVSSRHGVKATQCVCDAKSAVRWVRKNAARLGVDPKRIAAGGGSAGGHIAACTAFAPGVDEPGEDSSVSAVPNALVLFNPALVLAPLDGAALGGFGSKVPAERLGIEPETISPAHHIASGAPPTIVFHGRADTTVPYATAEAFAAKMKAAGARCELVGFDGQAHGFFNQGRNENKYFLETLSKADAFLASLGYLSGKPNVEEFFK